MFRRRLVRTGCEGGGDFGQYGLLRTDFKRCSLVEVGRQRQGGIGGGGGDFDAVGGVGGFGGGERTNREGGGETGEGEVVGLAGGHGRVFLR